MDQKLDQYMKIKKAHFINSSIKTNIKKDYKFIKEIGAGGFGVVFETEQKSTGIKRAIKAIAKDRVVDKESFKNELSILRKIDHPNILKMYEVYETEKTVYLVTEMCEGGELFYFITKTQHLTEMQAAKIMRQIFTAVAYLHEHKIVHRDLKPENFLLKNKNDESSIKLIDFGLARIFREDEVMTQPNGSLFYIAPEIIKGQYSYEVDYWSLGVILYVMMCGQPPFPGRNPQETIKNIQKGIFTFSKAGFKGATEEVRDLIQKLLVMEPKKRFTAKQAYNHPWVQQQVSHELMNLKLHDDTIKGLEKMINAQQMKKTMLLYLATFIPENEVTSLRQLFVSLDKDGNGMISLDEMIEGLTGFKNMKHKNMDKNFVTQLFKAMDIDQSGQVDYSEFIAAFLVCPQFQNERFIEEQFKKIDQDNSGRISKNELMDIFHTDTISIKDIDIEELIKQADLNKDGEIDYQEFMILLRDRFADQIKQ
ncbi:unnamed protein product [Paramecium sonneborni]|uniref:Protein kinase domain containing protein n=1 Tax=Paramecium sonneborni TaxID=65129 RepID=A0A8S1R6M8_9CILI|nr:unnamed protein product [Paramecium sonneborni]